MSDAHTAILFGLLAVGAGVYSWVHHAVYGYKEHDDHDPTITPQRGQ